VLTNPPTPEDFLSNAELGNVPRPPLTLERQRLWEGVFVCSTLEAAIDRAARLRPACRFIAVLNVPGSGAVLCTKTLRDPAHYTFWGAAPDILERVECIIALPDAANPAPRIQA
jgi:hypothetical protein